ncbi:1-phosphofructokinase family hexose kinase [Paludisphaera mucosa]|uniref:PfkB family carbohydrate kinase n=1 Tax=Paludisphaera mucosa TaxID=3030827 RepID=A0ABT6FG18_9BACT|nr:PfkB family carbohydrate kinase [Paludisphaera mucosa]MDG3006518.1 PfkB family carbohydrate kinase [Paludisphaera mucosa]
MILCVTLNPCLDKTLWAPAWRPGDSVRGRSLCEIVGGKGVNVARALARLGRAARPATFLGGPVGATCRRLLTADDGLGPIVVETEAATRVILTVATEGTTDQSAFFDPDPAIAPAEADALVAAIEKALDEAGVEALTLSGSSPSPATHAVYSELIALARARRIPVFLDTYGPAFEAIWGFWPTAIQMNRREAAMRLRRPTVGDDDVVGLLREWRRRGVACGIVTDGPAAALVQFGDVLFRAFPPEIEVVNPIGSGDSMLAGLVDAWLGGGGPEAVLRRALACGAANAAVWDAGSIEPQTVARLEPRVRLEPVP